jgi:hypothetical protein
MTEPDTAAVPAQRARLNQPRRALVAVAELLVAAAAVWVAFRVWPRGVTTITLVGDDGTRQEVTRLVGSWLAAAVGLGTLASLLVLDALRQVLLAVRARPRRGRATPDIQETPS